MTARHSRKCVICHKRFFTPPSTRRVTCSRSCRTKLPANSTTHGLSRSRLHNIWCGIKSRCSPGKSKAKKLYFYSGVTVCEEWRDSFQSFYTWSMSNGYRDELEIDRRLNTEGYSPSNCRWVTKAQQAANRRKYVRKNATSALKGVSRCNGRWRAIITIDGSPKHIGMFDTEKEAGLAYDELAKQQYGEHASLNFA